MPHEQADRLIEGTAEVSPMADNSFDSVVSQFGLMFLQKKCRLCTKMSFGGAVAQRPFCYEE
jgi:ubiquinone/menaquinone biosynthesis C-methylase UbiE